MTGKTMLLRLSTEGFFVTRSELGGGSMFAGTT